MTDINHKLDLLYDLLVDNFTILKNELIGLIAQPGKIDNTNKFASLLSELKNSDFIGPLLYQISLADRNDIWLTDYLYAAINLLEESSFDDEFAVPPNFIAKLEAWIINNKGELAWKAANLLKYLESEQAERIQLKKLEERGDFFLTYVECILGLLRYNKAKHMSMAKQIAEDETRDNELREFCRDIISRQY
ncbi:hypothetical protein [Mucilaginibacter sp.]|uniref:hypothetical protein n=1 Tax=Mucilaginibacter sp. TaxID=1882438 RepID=UPI003267F3FF